MTLRAAWLFLFAALVNCSLAEGEPLSAGVSWPCFTLHSETNWQLNLPEGERFDASTLHRRPTGELLTLNDRHEGVYRIHLAPNTNAADLELLPNCFTSKQLMQFRPDKIERYDCEGLTEDEKGRLYVCEEANRWILRFDPQTEKVERLEIDWSPVEKYFHPTDRNASFEAIAIAGDRLYVGNERQDGRIIVVDLNTLQILEDFGVRPSNTRAKDIHYTDFCYFEGSLFAVLRENHVVVKINPETKRIIAEYDYAEVERAADVAYENDTATASLMEGLVVDEKYFWLCVDNNGRSRKKFPNDPRPTLFRCPRPDTHR